MTTTLVINYTPRKGSYTKVLCDEFVKSARGKTTIVSLDLCEMPPDLLLPENLNLIIAWNQGKRDFSTSEQSLLANHHKYIDQLLEADYIVLAFPIYNFTLPATVKAWIDAVVVSDKTFSFDPASGFKGLCTGKKAVSIIVSGFNYSSSGHLREYASSTLQQNFDFMGIASEQVSAFGVDEHREQLDAILNQAKLDIKKLASRWFAS